MSVTDRAAVGMQHQAQAVKQTEAFVLCMAYTPSIVLIHALKNRMFGIGFLYNPSLGCHFILTVLEARRLK